MQRRTLRLLQELGLGKFTGGILNTIGLRSYGPDVFRPKIVDYGTVSPTSTGKFAAPMMPGKIWVQFGLYDGVLANIESGKTTLVTLTDPSHRRITKIVAPERELPTATCTKQRADETWRIGTKNQWGTFDVSAG